jgi:hypothetical protein
VQVEERSDFDVVVDATSSVWRVSACGEIDVAVSGRWAAALGRIPDGVDVEIDLRQVTFIDLTGLRPVLALSDGGRRAVRVLHPPPLLPRMLRIFGAQALVEIEDAGGSDTQSTRGGAPSATADRTPAPHDLEGSP